jgi:hypothetical protein
VTADFPAEYEPWLRQHFPAYFTDALGAPLAFAPYHHALWQWVWALRPGVRPQPFIGVWPRGAGKSTTAEMACVAMGQFRLRRYGLYICATQDLADDHVGSNVSGLFETAGVERLVGKYGQSRGWRRNRLRTADGFTVDALGLDVAARGVKLEENRPDFLIIDDIDQDNDTELLILKKIRSLTRKLLPAGSADLAVLAVQNLVHEQSIFARLVDGRADFLSDRTVSGPYVALEGLVYTGEGKDAVLTAGIPPWEGLSLARCQSMVKLMGLDAFLAECQHEQRSLQGTMLGDVWMPGIHIIEPFDIPTTWRIRRAFDWGSSKPFSVGWWAHSDGETPIGPDERVYLKGTRFRIGEYYGWNGKPNEGLRMTNTEIARRIKDIESNAPWRGRIEAGPADSQIFDVVNGTSIAHEMGTQSIAWKPAQKGPGSRRQGAQILRQLLKASLAFPMEEPGLFVFSTCRQFLRTVPTLPRDLVDQDDVDSDKEDHCYDETRYECTMPLPPRAGMVEVAF